MGSAFRLEDSPSGFPLQVLAEDGSGLSGPTPNAKHPNQVIVHKSIDFEPGLS